MMGYYLKLAARSLARNPGLTSLMVLAIALGIAVCVVTLTVHHGMSSNPIWWKNDRLYAVTVDAWDPERPANEKRPALPPPDLTWRDAEAITRSDTPQRAVRMFKGYGVLSAGDPASKARPEQVLARVTTADFFDMFEVPFRFGNGWKSAADTGPEPVIVLSEEMNEHFFGGADSVGKTIRWDDREYRVIGVLEHWHPAPKFYDVNNGAFDDPEEIYIPFGWTDKLELRSAGNTNCWKPEDIQSFADFLRSECVWLQVWVELPDAAARERMQSYLDNYVAGERRNGRFQRPNNNRLTKVDQWLADNDVVGNDSPMLVALAFAFFTVCLINTVGLLLAKFLGSAALTGVRRALGASRKQIFLQHLTEAGLLASLGAALGVVLAGAGLWGLRIMYASPREGLTGLMHVNAWSLVITVALAIGASLAAGLYPAWRVGRLAPAVYLKSQ